MLNFETMFSGANFSRHTAFKIQNPTFKINFFRVNQYVKERSPFGAILDFGFWILNVETTFSGANF